MGIGIGRNSHPIEQFASNWSPIARASFPAGVAGGVVGLLLIVGGLLFYFFRRKVERRRQPLTYAQQKEAIEQARRGLQRSSPGPKTAPKKPRFGKGGNLVSHCLAPLLPFPP